MKNIKFFKTRKEYSGFIYTEIIQNKEFHIHRYYRGLIEFIIDHRSPIFFNASMDYEYAHFTQFFNFSLIRENYESTILKDMYFIHDFVHMVFDNPLQLKEYTLPYFSQVAIYNEYAAANDTEILIYYRIPELRAKTFKDKIFYDVLLEKFKKQPDVRYLFELRRSIIDENDFSFFKSIPDSKNILDFLTKFKDNNTVWCENWYDKFPKLQIDYSQKRTALPILDYEEYLENYSSDKSEERYRDNILYNTQVAAEIASLKLPQKFEECEDTFKELEGKVLLEDVAMIFNDQYQKSKK
jgi:hypothetical protein